MQSSGVSTSKIRKLCAKQANCGMNPISTHYGNHSSKDCWLCLGNQSADAIQCIHWLKRNGLRPREPFCHQFCRQVNMNAVCAAECLANRGIHLFVRLLHSKSSKSPVHTMKEPCAHYVGNMFHQHQKNKCTVRTQRSCTLGAKVLTTAQVQCPHHIAKVPNSHR